MRAEAGRRLATALVVLALLVAGGGDRAHADDAAAIRAVISDQLAAFRRDDGEAAFAFAAPAIREKFGDAANFLRMVREGYGPVYRPREVEFGALSAEDGRLVQRVLLVGPDGVPVTALYFMERQPDGSWKISGCVLTAAADKTI